MIEIFVLLLTLFLAKHPKRRRKFRRYLRGSIDLKLALSTLGSKVLISAGVSGAVIERTFVSSLVATWSLKDLTTAADDGPIIVGVAHSDYTDAEIEEFIENAGSWNEGDQIAQEKAKRKIRIVGTFEDTANTSVETFVLNHGDPIRTKLNWILTTTKTLKMFAYNAGSSALAGTADLNVYGHANLWPQ